MKLCIISYYVLYMYDVLLAHKYEGNYGIFLTRADDISQKKNNK